MTECTHNAESAAVICTECYCLYTLPDIERLQRQADAGLEALARSAGRISSLRKQRNYLLLLAIGWSLLAVYDWIR